MVSMKDVSRHAGVSVATVSNVITGKRQVSESVRRRVLDSIAALNYQVNLVARGLKTQRTSTIGLILPDITKLFFQRVITGILTEASQMGYRLNILNSGYDFQTERTLINMLRASRVDGIILDSCVNRENAAQWAEELQRGGQGAQPVVSLENTLYSQSVSSVTLDCALYSGMITQHLFDLGRRRVLYVAGPLSIEHEYNRLRGYRECHEKNGLQAAAEMEKHGGYLSESGYVAVREALTDGLRFDAVQIQLFAVQVNLALRGRINAVENLHQRGFAGAVFAHQGMHGTALDAQRNIVERHNTGECFGDSPHFQYVFRHVASPFRPQAARLKSFSRAPMPRSRPQNC